MRICRRWYVNVCFDWHRTLFDRVDRNLGLKFKILTNQSYNTNHTSCYDHSFTRLLPDTKKNQAPLNLNAMLPNCSPCSHLRLLSRIWLVPGQLPTKNNCHILQGQKWTVRSVNYKCEITKAGFVGLFLTQSLSSSKLIKET
jgi:hypothetical protein